MPRPTRPSSSTPRARRVSLDVPRVDAEAVVEARDGPERPVRSGPFRPAPPGGSNALDVRMRSRGWLPLTRIKRPADAVMPPTEQYELGQPVTATIKGVPVHGTLMGFDHAGRAVIDAKGQRRLAHIDDVEGGKPTRSTLHALPKGAVVQAPPAFARAMQAALDKVVVGTHCASEYVDALVARGYEVFIVGGAVRDAVKLLADDPHAPQADLLDVMHDVDIVTTAPPSVVREVCRAVAPELKAGGVWSPPAVDGFGAVLAGGKKSGIAGGDGIDICTLKSSRIEGTPKAELDVNEKTFHATFTRSLLQDAEARDFCCNALYYDPVNQAVVDPTMHGLADAARGRLHLAPSADVVEDKTIVARFWKFRLRGYDADEETLVRVKRHAEHAYDLQDGKARWELASSLGRAAPKDLTTPKAAQKWLDELRSVMREDGCGGLFDREMTPRMRGFVTNEVLKRTRPR